MKKLLIFSMLLLCFASCKEDDPVTTPDPSETPVNDYSQKALIYYNGATWCAPCGTIGKPVYESLEEEFKDESNVILFTAHTNQTSDLYSEYAEELNFAIPPISNVPLPAYFVNFNLQLGNTVEDLGAAISNETNTILEGADSYGKIIIDAMNTNSGELMVTATAEFLEEQNLLGHSMQLFLYRKSVMNLQIGAGSEEIAHKNVVTRVAGEAPSVQLEVGEGSLVPVQEMGKTFTQNFTVSTSGYADGSYGAFIVLWSQDFANNNRIDGYVNAVDIGL